MAMVTGLVPILRAAIDATTDYNGRSVWFGCLSVRLITLFIAERPWSKLDFDFQCNGNASEFCRKSCFNAHFDIAIVSFWNLTFLLFLTSVLLMELFAWQLHHNLVKSKMKEAAKRVTEGQSDLTGVNGKDPPRTEITIDFHRQKRLLGIYLTCVILRLILETSFIYLLVIYHLPKVVESPINCSTGPCSGPYICMVRGTADKRMSIFMLCGISGVIIVTSVIFALYSTCHYMLFHRKFEGRPI
ncbi:gap junction beta-1 protein-like [Lissotriton helveticus]